VAGALALSEETSIVSYADMLAAISSAFKEILQDPHGLVKEFGERDGPALTSWHRQTKAHIDALHAMALKLEKGETILVPCASCGYYLSIFDLWKNKATCGVCYRFEEEYEEDYL
jgi:hypothetical protein